MSKMTPEKRALARLKLQQRKKKDWLAARPDFHKKGGLASKGRRKKGHDFERYIARRFQDVDPSARRNLEEYREGTVDISTVLPFAVQCKRLKRWSINPPNILKQAIAGCRDGNIPIGIVKLDRTSTILVLMLKKHAEILWPIEQLDVMRFKKDFHLDIHHGLDDAKYVAQRDKVGVFAKPVYGTGHNTYTIYYFDFEDFIYQVRKVFKDEAKNLAPKPFHQPWASLPETSLTLTDAET